MSTLEATARAAVLAERYGEDVLAEVLQELYERDIPQSARDKMPAADFAGKDRSFPISTPEDVSAAVHSMGRAGSDNYSTDELKRRIIAIAKRKGGAFVAALPDDWKSGGSSESDAFIGLTSDVVSLTERSVRPDNTVTLKVIKPGWGATGYYSPEVLKQYGPKAFPAGTQMYLDHPTESENRERPERSVRDLAAVLSGDASYEENGKAGPGLYAAASVLPAYKDVVEQLAPYIGVSIRAHGNIEPGEAEGRRGAIIKSITSSESVDFVTKPGAGGKVLQLWESIRAKQPDTYHITYTDNTAASEAAESTPSTEAEDMELKEAQDKITELETKLSESATEVTKLTERAERAETALVIVESEKVAHETLAKVSLPDAAKERIIKAAVFNPPMKDGVLDGETFKAALEESAKVESAYLAGITGTGKVTGQGAPASGEPQIDAAETAKKFSSFFGMDEKTAKIAVAGRKQR